VLTVPIGAAAVAEPVAAAVAVVEEDAAAAVVDVVGSRCQIVNAGGAAVG
jgi:hypothetical protein